MGNIKHGPKRSIYPWLKSVFQSLPTAFRGLGRNYLDKELDYVSGLETEEENPSQLLVDKGQDETFYDTLLLDNTIATALDLKKAITLSVDGSVKPTSDDPKDRERAEWLDEMLYRMGPNIWTTFDNALDAWAYGFKVAEKVFKIGTEGKFKGAWIIDKVKFMHSTFFDFGYAPDGTLDRLIIGKDYGGTKDVRGFKNIMAKFMILTWPYPIDGNWYGRSDLDAIYVPYYQKYQIYRWRGIYLQGFGMPVIKAIYEQKKMSESELNDLDDALQNWQEQMFFKIPAVRDKEGNLKPKFELELMEKDNTSTDAYENSIKQLDADMKRRLLIPDNLGYSDNRKGALAQSKTEAEMFFKVIRGILGRLEDYINPHIRQVEAMNFSPVENFSEWRFDEITPKLEAEIIKTLIEKGVVDPKEQWVRPYLGIPTITVEEAAELDKAVEEPVTEPKPEPEAQAPPKDDEPDDSDNMKTQTITASDATTVTLQAKNPPFDAKKAEKVYDEAEDGFVTQYNKLHNENEDWVIKKVEKKYDPVTKDYKWVARFQISPQYKKKLKKTLTLYYYDLFFAGRDSAIDETKDKLPETMQIDYTMKPDDLKKLLEEEQIKEYGDLGILTRTEAQELRNIQERTFTLVGDDNSRQLKAITTELREALDTDRPLRETIAKLQSVLSSDRKKFALTIARTNASTAYNAGRASWFNSPRVNKFIEAYEYSAILDDRTTEFCRAHDGQIIKKGDPTLSLIWPPNHFNCRSTLTAVMVGDELDKNSYFHDYEERFPEWGSNKNGAGETFDMGKKEVRLPSKGFGG